MKKILSFVGGLSTFLIGSTALAAADAEIVSNSEAMLATAKDNIFGIITANAVSFALLLVGIIGFFFVIRVIKRLVGGR